MVFALTIGLAAGMRCADELSCLLNVDALDLPEGVSALDLGTESGTTAACSWWP